MRINPLFFNSLYYMRDNINDMSRTERTIAGYILKNPSAIVADTLRVSAEKIGVSEGSIINFSKKLGFDGFSALKLNVAQCITPVSHPESTGDLCPEHGSKMMVKQVMDNLTASFRATYDLLSEESLDQAIRMITGAEQIEIYGITSSAVLADDMSYRLMKLGLPVKAVTDALICPVSAMMLNEKSLVIAISASGRTAHLLRAINIAREQGAKVLSITSSAVSPLAKFSDLTLTTGTTHLMVDNFSNEAKVVQLFLIEALCTCLAFRDKEQSTANQDRIDRLWDEFYSK